MCCCLTSLSLCPSIRLQVTIEATGARALAPSPAESMLSMYLSHPGRAEVVSQEGQLHSYTHLERFVYHVYDVASKRVITQVGVLCSSKACTRPRCAQQR